jgi:hypothetical protein
MGEEGGRGAHLQLSHVHHAFGDWRTGAEDVGRVADVYDWFLPDQYIEMSGLPDGFYLLETLVDPDDTILEADESNHCGAVYVRLSDMTTATPRAVLVGPARECVRQK